jgi:hypothetical protein
MAQRGLAFGAFSVARNTTIFDGSVTLSFIAAMVISFTSELLTYPFAVLMKRMMYQAGQQTKIFKSPLDCLKFTLEREGLRGLYRGYLVSLLITLNRFLLML